MKILLFLILSAFSANAEILHGKVIGISDGDSLTLLDLKNKQHKIRLAHIDAPELGQPFGEASKQALSVLVFSKQVEVKKIATDKYERLICHVHYNGKWINQIMVKEGFAWAYIAHSPLFSKEQARARGQRLGLWKDGNAISPSEFRKREKRKHLEGEKLAYWLNSSSGVRHNSSCRSFQNTKEGRICQPTEGTAAGCCGG